MSCFYLHGPRASRRRGRARGTRPAVDARAEGDAAQATRVAPTVDRIEGPGEASPACCAGKRDHVALSCRPRRSVPTDSASRASASPDLGVGTPGCFPEFKRAVRDETARSQRKRHERRGSPLRRSSRTARRCRLGRPTARTRLGGRRTRPSRSSRARRRERVPGISRLRRCATGPTSEPPQPRRRPLPTRSRSRRKRMTRVPRGRVGRSACRSARRTARSWSRC